MSHRFNKTSHTMKNNKDHINTQGASYFASNAFGWATARTPWEALAKLDLSYNGKRPSLNSKTFAETTKSVMLWFLPDEDKFQRIENYCPADAEGKQYGVCLFAGTHEFNERAVFNKLSKQIEA